MLVRIPSNKTKNCYWIFDGSNARQKAFVGIIFISKFELLELKGMMEWWTDVFNRSITSITVYLFSRGSYSQEEKF